MRQNKIIVKKVRHICSSDKNQGIDFSAFGLNSAPSIIIFSVKFNRNIQKKVSVFSLFSPKCHFVIRSLKNDIKKIISILS